jgi:hypothetical protein
MMSRAGKEVSAMPSAKKTARILPTGAVQKIIDMEMPGFRVVEMSPEPADSRDTIVRKASRSLPSLVQLRQAYRPDDAANAADAEPAARAAGAIQPSEPTEESLWGNSSQFAIVEPTGVAAGFDTVRRRRTVIVSHGRVITEQG